MLFGVVLSSPASLDDLAFFVADLLSYYVWAGAITVRSFVQLIFILCEGRHSIIISDRFMELLYDAVLSL